MPKLTKREVEKAKPKGRDFFIWCDELPGFGVRVFASGKRSYLIQYRAGGRTRRVTIGLHGRVTCEDARNKAKKLLGQVADGENPADERETSRKAMGIKQLCESYLAATEKGLVLGKRGLPKKESTLVTDRGRIARHILPLLGTRKVKDISTPDVIRFLRDVSTGKTAADVKTKLHGRAIVEGGKGTAARTVGLLGGIFSFAVSEGIILNNPVRGVKRPADERKEVRLSSSQYRALGAALDAAENDGAPWQAITAIKLLALTGCRRGEIETLRWENVDLEGRCLRLADSKTGKSVRPLGNAAAAILAKLPRTGDFVLPRRLNDKPFSGLPKVWPRIISHITNANNHASMGELALLAKLTPHGLRHAFASIAAEIGFTEITIAALLGHSSGTVTGRYIHQVDTALVAAADRVAAHIAVAMDGKKESAEIVPLRKVK